MYPQPSTMKAPEPLIQPTQQAVPMMPMNIVVNTNTGSNPGAINAVAKGGFLCPYCQCGVMKRHRNPIIKWIIVIVALLTFPLGLLACLLCFTPIAYHCVCTTCKKKMSR